VTWGVKIKPKLKIPVHIHTRMTLLELYFHPDPPHVFKNLRDILTNGYQITIPDYFSTKFKLPSATVSISENY
jgi:hypothetical protein